MAVPAGQRAQITLADGTKVWLNAQSTLTYSHDFGRNERNVELDGGAYFEVAKNREIPFYVNTETNQVRIVETHFNVCAYRGSNEFTTTLLEGIVDIYAKGSEHSLTRLGGVWSLVRIQSPFQYIVIMSVEWLSIYDSLQMLTNIIPYNH